MGEVICAANSSNMLFYFNEEKFGKVPEQVKKELKALCAGYCADVGGIITLGLDDRGKLIISVLDPIDEIGSEIKVRKMQREEGELFLSLERFAKEFKI